MIRFRIFELSRALTRKKVEPQMRTHPPTLGRMWYLFTPNLGAAAVKYCARMMPVKRRVLMKWAEIGGHLHSIVAAAQQQQTDGECAGHTHQGNGSHVGEGVRGNTRLQPAAAGIMDMLVSDLRSY